MHDQDVNHKQQPNNQRYLYTWASDYLYFHKQSISQEDVVEQTNIQKNECYKEWKECLKQTIAENDPSPILTSFKKYKQKQFRQAYILDFLGYQINFYLPLLFYFVALNIINKRYNSLQNILVIAAIIVLQFTKMIAHLHSENKFKRLGETIYRYVAIALVQKSLRYSILSNKQFKSSQISKLMHLDCEKFLSYHYCQSTTIFHLLALVANSIVIVFISGWAGLIGLVVLYLTLSIRFLLKNRLNQLEQVLAQKSNQRIKSTIDIFAIIKFIKVNALQLVYFSKIQQYRKNQINKLKQKFCFELIPVFMVTVSAKLVILIIGWVSIIFNHEFNVALILGISLAFDYCNMIIVLSNFILIKNANISIEKIQSFLKTQEIDTKHISREDYIQNQAIKLEGSFYWKSYNPRELITQQNWHLKNIQLTIKKGQLVGIIGSYGSGKSSIINALLGEMLHEEGASIQINGSLAYVSQKSWIMNASVRNNILFGRKFNSNLYSQVIYYSCLKSDLDILDAGDQTIIGERGCTLSGGQKTRISLARALYSQANIIILDDILSALDAHIGTFIFKQTLNNYKKGTTILLITHSLSFMKYTDKIVIVEEGRILQQGTYEQVKNNPILLTIQTSTLKDHIRRDQLLKQPIFSQSKFSQIGEELINQYQVFKQYLHLNGGFHFTIISLVYVVLLSICTCIGRFWNVVWANSSNFHESYFIYIYLIIMMLCSMLIILIAIIIQWSQIFARVHDDMIISLLLAPLRYFQTTPIDKIINRLSSDLNTNDRKIASDYLSGSSNVAIAFSFLIGIIMVFIIYNQFLLMLISICYFAVLGYFYYRFFVTSRQLHHLQEAAIVPINSTFSQTLNGLSTIRAYQAEDQTKSAFLQTINRLSRIVIATAGVDSWLKLILTFCFSLYSIFIIVLIFYKQFGVQYDVFLVFNALAMNQLFQRVNINISDFLMRLHSLGRCRQLATIEPEIGYKHYFQNYSELIVATKDEPPIFGRGQIKFVDFSVKYRPQMPMALKNINLNIQARQKIGIVGRTGSGKSTLILSLLRILEAAEGHIEVDGHDISKLSLQSLRSNINVILQDHFLCPGTIRQNVNPTGNCSDAQITRVLTLCGLWDQLQKREGLDSEVAEGGDNFSAGEKQLMAIARSILTPRKIVLVDEATANIDVNSDQHVQALMNNMFSDSTVLTIAHRIASVINSDRILVLQKGEIAQFDTPHRLLSNPNSLFSRLYVQSGKKID